MSASSPSAGVSPIVHLKRAFGWNLGRVTPSPGEASRLAAAGVTDPTVQRYAAWRHSLLLTALVPAVVAAALGLFDAVTDGFDEFTTLGVLLHVAWLAAACALPVACVMGMRHWARPGVGARVLLASWLVTFLLPLLYALLPTDVLYHVEPAEAHPAAVAVVEHAAEHVGADLEDVDVAEKLASMQELAVDFVLSGAAFLMLLPAVLSLIPGAVNGCLRIKSLLPAAQLPGWLLVTVAPAFLLFWLVMLVLLTPAVDGPLLLIGVVLWSGSALLYALHGRVFVQSQIGSKEAARIGHVKRMAGIVGLAGIAFLVGFVLTTRVAGLHVLGADEERAMSVRIEELSDADDVVGLQDVRDAYADSEALVYALDPAFLRSVVDLLAKILLVTVVFADLVLRATLTGWRNERALRARSEAREFDASAAAATAALGSPAV